MPVFEVSVARQAVKETSADADPSQLGSQVLPAISVCDVELVHMSHISDEEDYRFQMASPYMDLSEINTAAARCGNGGTARSITAAESNFDW